jgi:hypothetical protein
MPKKITRFCGAVLTTDARRPATRCKVLHRHVLDEVDLARQQGRDARRGVLDRGDR